MNKRIFWKFLRSGRIAALVLLMALLLSIALSGCSNAENGGQQTETGPGQQHLRRSLCDWEPRLHPLPRHREDQMHLL